MRNYLTEAEQKYLESDQAKFNAWFEKNEQYEASPYINDEAPPEKPEENLYASKIRAYSFLQSYAFIVKDKTKEQRAFINSTQYKAGDVVQFNSYSEYQSAEWIYRLQNKHPEVSFEQRLKFGYRANLKV